MSGQRFVGWLRRRGGLDGRGRWFAVADGACLERVERDTARARAEQPFVLCESIILPEGVHPAGVPRVRVRPNRKEKPS
jgi:hypothetical protein